jgi:hypothetical protein
VAEETRDGRSSSHPSVEMAWRARAQRVVVGGPIPQVPIPHDKLRDGANVLLRDILDATRLLAKAMAGHTT